MDADATTSGKAVLGVASAIAGLIGVGKDLATSGKRKALLVAASAPAFQEYVSSYAKI
jgi:hypothetical protein